MIIREYNSEDIKEMAELFFTAVHGVCSGDYTKEQLNAWAAEDMDTEAWNRSSASMSTRTIRDRESQRPFVTDWRSDFPPVLLQHMLP